MEIEMIARRLTRRRGLMARARRGVATVELAVCLPVLLLLVVGAIEGSNFIFLKQAVTVAAYESVHVVSRAGGSATEARTRAEQILAARSIDGATIQFSPAAPESAPRGQLVSVSISAPASANSIGLDWLFSNRSVSASVRMLKD
jgi:Flp pilus assembly protein TadG